MQTHFTREALTELLSRARAQGRDAGVIERLEWIAYFLDHGSSLDETSAHFGISTGTLHRWMKRFDPRDLSTLEERSHTPHNVRTSAVPPEVIEWVRGYRMSQPLIGKERIAQLLREEHQVSLSSSTVGRIIEREKLYFASTPLHWKKRFDGAPAVAALETVPESEPSLPQLSQQEISSPECDCAFCRLGRWDWKRIRSSMAWSLIVANIVFMGIVFGTVWREHAQAHLQESPVIHTVAPSLDGHLSDTDTSASSASQP